MSKIIRTRKPSVLPYYAAALVFVVLCAVLPVYRLWALAAALAAAAPQAPPLPMRMLGARVLAQIQAGAGRGRAAANTAARADAISQAGECRGTGRRTA